MAQHNSLPDCHEDTSFVSLCIAKPNLVSFNLRKMWWLLIAEKNPRSRCLPATSEPKQYLQKEIRPGSVGSKSLVIPGAPFIVQQKLQSSAE